jgi:hypothetical protein
LPEFVVISFAFDKKPTNIYSPFWGAIYWTFIPFWGAKQICLFSFHLSLVWFHQPGQLGHLPAHLLMSWISPNWSWLKRFRVAGYFHLFIQRTEQPPTHSLGSLRVYSVY